MLRGRAIKIQDAGILVRVHWESEDRLVGSKDVNARVTLPWKPHDLSHALIILRRRNRLKDEYIEDLCKENEYLIKYDLLNNMGYGTQKHRDAIKDHGITKYHRKSFKGCC